jgi:hypothetical protein
MALKPDNEQRPEDAPLAALYREAAVERPSERLDRLIQDRARRPEQSLTPAKQTPWWSSWRAPFVAAALAVVSASLVLVMTERGGERAVLSPATPAPDAPERSASGDEREPRLLSEAPTESEPLVKGRAKPPRKAEHSAAPLAGSGPPRAAPELKPIEPGRPDAASADARVLSARRPKSPVASDENQASSIGERDAPAAAKPQLAVPPAAVSPPPISAGAAQEPRTGTAAAKPAPSNDALASRRMQAARVAPNSPSPAAALITELEGQPAPRWIERIVTLRRDGRRHEAEALLAEFKLRYPSEPLPPGLQRNDE